MPDEIENAKVSALDGAVTLVTGGSRGIGLAIARRLGRMGARIAICARRAEGVETALQELARENIVALGAAADVTRSDEIAAFVARIEAEWGPVEILVNNAGLGLFGPFHQRSEAEWDTVLDTNLKSVFLVSRAVVPKMIERRRGEIVNISSLAGKNAFTGGGLYCASKWGLMGLNNCMAEELRPHGIRVGVVCPGSVATEFSPTAGRKPGTILQADDVAHVVATILTQGPDSFVGEVDLRPRQKP